MSDISHMFRVSVMVTILLGRPRLGFSYHFCVVACRPAKMLRRQIGKHVYIIFIAIKFFILELIFKSNITHLLHF